MGVARESPAASERDRDDELSKPDDSAASFQTRLPPPVAMSLRTRESSSLALKHIFDQINASAENSQPVDSLFGRTVAVLDKRDDDGKRDGPGLSKEVSGMVRSAGPEVDARQRMGGVHVPRKQGQREEWTSFRFNSSDSKGEEFTGQQQVNRGPPPHGFAEADSMPQLASEKDSRCGFRMCDRTVAPRFQDAGGNGENVHRSPLQEELANFSPRSPGVASLPQDLPLRKRLPELDLSFRKTQNHDSSFFLPAETAFGSPISAPSQQSSMDGVYLPNSITASWSMRSIQQGPLPQAASRPSTTNSLNKQPTAQLTIFYSGMVNVYDDVPADKANAIMLLAGNGNSWSTNHRAPPPERERVPSDLSPPATQSPVAVSANVAVGTVVTGTIAAKTFSPPVVANSSLVPSSPVTAPAADPKPQTPAKRSHPGIELPHARKASLARFLEKRKDRVQVKQPIGIEGQDNGKSESESPCSPKKQRSERSRSPSPTRSVPGSRADNSSSKGQLSLATSAPRRFIY